MSEGADYPLEVSVHDLKRALDAGSAAVVDVREPWEHDVARIEGAKLIPLSEFAARALEELPRDGPILIHCHHGGRSMQATQWLRRQGYDKVANVAGGIDAWSQLIDPGTPRY